jgi:deoxyribodipyrimidine photolyase-related protein
MNLLILPNQLFNIKYISKEYSSITIWENPHFFNDYKYNKKKLILHRASMKYYYEYLKNKKRKVFYCEFNKTPKINDYYLFDPINDLSLLNLPSNYTIIESPNFLLTKNNYNDYRNKTDKFFFNSFYMWGKQIIDIIPNVKSQDKENRKKMPKNIEIPEIVINKDKNEKKIIEEAINYINLHFSENYGVVEDFMFPISHKTAKQWLDNFINKKFKLFGDYQDFMDKNNDFLFHSLLSTSINIGLLNPSEIIKSIIKLKNIPMNSYEGFIRQLFWREYQRYCYIFFNFNNKNYFENNKKLSKIWYSGETKIKPIDDCIIKGFKTGYLHHIERLMVIGNYMNLCGISPKEGFKWFMEFSCDSYEWVMKQNVLDMVFFCSGGKTMRRPYICSSNYILKNSNYQKDEWCNKIDLLYHDFLKNNKEKLIKYKYYYKL